MDEKNKTGRLNEPVGEPNIQPDEAALRSPGLSRPEDREVDRIIQEIQTQVERENPDPEPAVSFDTVQLMNGEVEEAIRAQRRANGETKAVHVQTESEPAPVKKGRPGRKKTYAFFGIPHILATAVWLAVLVLVGVSLGRVIWVCATDVLAFGREEQEVVITIEDADTLDTIAEKLQENGLIRYPELFKLFANIKDAREDISSGTFTLNTVYDYNALINFMSSYSATREEVTVLIPEGYTCAQIFSLLESKGVCTVAELEEYAANGELNDYWFLEGLERGDKYCLEGYLFPDTYDFYLHDDAGRVLNKLLRNFNYRFSDEMKEAIDTLNDTLAAMMKKVGYGKEYIEANKMTVREVVIVASLIEKETAGSSESANIASVIYNRLTNQKAYPYLNIDAALLYAIGHREVISAEDKQADTPYNTYLYKGLVPGPISNPGLSSLKAALYPNSTKYHYYALDPDTGLHHFTKTYEEHLKFLASLE